MKHRATSLQQLAVVIAAAVRGLLEHGFSEFHRRIGGAENAGVEMQERQSMESHQKKIL